MKDGLPLRSRIRGRRHIWWHRACNRWWDLRAVLAGYCNDCPWRADPAEGGGYRHWRCALQRNHEGLHRYGNSVWTEDGQTDYLPIRTGLPWPSQPRRWERSMTPTRRQERASRRWHEQARANIRARRGEAT